LGGHIRIVSGNNQVIRALETSAPFVIQAVDDENTPLAGVEVTFFLGVRSPTSTRSTGSHVKYTGRDGKVAYNSITPILAGSQYIVVYANGDRIDLLKSKVIFRLDCVDR